MSTSWEHVVVGAGVSGLGLAHRAVRAGIPTLVLERGERVGGCVNSRTFPGCGDFWAEGGAHTCFNSYGHLIDILRDLGLQDRLTAKAKTSYSLWSGGQRRSILSALHPLELAVSLPRLFARDKAGRSVADYYGGGLGRRNYQDLFGPAFRAVICQPADDFPADLLFRRKPRRKEVLRSFTFPRGLSDIPRAMAEQPGLSLRTASPVSAVHRTGDRFQVIVGDGEELRCRFLSLAVPPDVAASLIPEAMGDLRRAVAGIGTAETESLILCVPAAELGHLPPLAGLIAVDDAFYSMVSRDYLADPRYRGFTFHFRSGALAPAAQVEHACRVLGIHQEQVAGIDRAINRLPALRAGHLERVARIDALLAGTRLALTGNWFVGVSIEDCLTRSHREFLRLFAG
ncbi:MAG: FAD-dependent oxidoreductase [Chromatiaceae bacterium]|jgi:protoporphyrinogen oxidase|nr:FAD-dependent oxidoreductase [Chromatiaceae bacterium]